MAWSRVQGKSTFGTTAGGITATLDAAATAGNLLVVFVATGTSTGTPDHFMDAPASLIGLTDVSVNQRGGRLYYKIAVGGETAFTYRVQVGGVDTNSNKVLIVEEYHWDASGPVTLVSENGQTTSATSHESPSVSTPADGDLVIGAAMTRNASQTYSNQLVNGSTSGVADRNQLNASSIASADLWDKLSGAAGAKTAKVTVTNSAAGTAHIAIFTARALVSAGGTVTPGGAMVKIPGIKQAGAVSPAGALAKTPAISAAGSVTSAGALGSWALDLVVAGEIAPVGALIVVGPPVRGRIIPQPETLVQALAGNHRLASRALFLTPDLADVRHEVSGRLLDGSVTAERLAQPRRRGNVLLLNVPAIYTPESPASLVWPGSVVRLERGAWVNGSPEYHPMLTGMVWGNPKVQGPRARKVSFAVISRLQRAARPFPQSITFPRGTRIRDVIRALLELAGFGTGDALYDLDDGGAVLLADRAFEPGTDSILAQATALAFANGLDGPNDSGLGVATLRPWLDPAQQQPTMTFQVGVNGRLLDGDLEIGTDVLGPNRQVVRGYGEDGYPFEVEARDLDPRSPTYNPPDGTGPLGDLPAELVDSKDTHRIEAALVLARWKLYERSLGEARVKGRSIANPFAVELPLMRWAATAVDITTQPDSVTVGLRGAEMSLVLRALRSQLDITGQAAVA